MRKFPGSDVRELFLFFPGKGVYLPVNRISPAGVIPIPPTREMPVKRKLAKNKSKGRAYGTTGIQQSSRRIRRTMAKEINAGLQIIYRKLSEMHPNPKNPRKQGDDGIVPLAESIEANPQFFEARPILLSDRTGQLVIIGGERRWEAAQYLERENAPSILFSGLTEEQEDEILIKDNTHAGVWDVQKLQAWDKGRLQSWNVDGVKWPKKETEIKEDDFNPDKKVKARCKSGDIWQLGNHRLMCGDSTDADCIAKLMNGQKADITITSPPYNAGYLGKPGREETKKKYLNSEDTKTNAEYADFLIKNISLLLANSHEIFYNIGIVSGSKVAVATILYEFREQFKDIIYWMKSNPVNAIHRGVISSSTELVLCFGENNTRAFRHTDFGNGGYFLGVITGSVASSNEYAKIHKATFPIYLPSEIICKFSFEGDLVLDCFGGTGTTLIAAEQLGRRCFMMELDPNYCDVILDRWEQFSGKKAEKIQ